MCGSVVQGTPSTREKSQMLEEPDPSTRLKALDLGEDVMVSVIVKLESLWSPVALGMTVK